MTQIEILQVKFTKEMFERIPDSERRFFIYSGHLLNELCLIFKLYLCSVLDVSKQANSSSQIFATTQALLFTKLIAGKLHESHELIRKLYFNDRALRDSLHPLLSSSATEALQNLKKYFSSNNCITQIRNEYAFHYDMDIIDSSFAAVSEHEDWCIFLSQLHENSLYYASELVVNHGLLNKVNSNSFSSALVTIQTDVETVKGWIVEFLAGCMVAIYETRLDTEENGEIEKEIFKENAISFEDAVFSHYIFPSTRTSNPASPN